MTGVVGHSLGVCQNQINLVLLRHRTYILSDQARKKVVEYPDDRTGL